MTLRRRIQLLLTLAAGLSACGCGKSAADVAGRVTYQGRPVEGGWILILGAGGNQHYCALGPDGRYAVAGARPGSVQVAIASPSPQTATIQARKRTALEKRAGATQSEPAAEASTWVQLPDHYSDPNQSKLVASLQPGANVLDLDLD
jgi:hypothetical protein